MTEFLPRTEPVASVVSATERGISGLRSGAAAMPAASHAETEAQQDAQLTERSAAVASYARLQADIAETVARLDPPRPNGAEMAGHAAQNLLALMPQPVVVLPMPPTDQKMIEFVAQVAQSLASQAAMARAAQAHVSSAVVDAAAA
jgi:hypothetical protein